MRRIPAALGKLTLSRWPVITVLVGTGLVVLLAVWLLATVVGDQGQKDDHLPVPLMPRAA